jgi:hypothetical protein
MGNEMKSKLPSFDWVVWFANKADWLFFWCASPVIQADRKCSCTAVEQQDRQNAGMFTAVLASGSEGQNMLLTYSASVPPSTFYKKNKPASCTDPSHTKWPKSSLTSIIAKFKMNNIQFTKQLSWGPYTLCIVGNKMKQLLWSKCSVISRKPLLMTDQPDNIKPPLPR